MALENRLYSSFNRFCFYVKTLRSRVLGFFSENKGRSVDFEEYDCHLHGEYPE